MIIKMDDINKAAIEVANKLKEIADKIQRNQYEKSLFEKIIDYFI